AVAQDAARYCGGGDAASGAGVEPDDGDRRGAGLWAAQLPAAIGVLPGRGAAGPAAVRGTGGVRRLPARSGGPVRARKVHPPLLGAGAVVITLLATGCGQTGGESKTPAPTPAPAGAVSSIAAQVPSAIKARGTLTVATDATYAPNEFIASD